MTGNQWCQKHPFWGLFMCLFAMVFLIGGCAWDIVQGWYNPYQKPEAIFKLDEDEAYLKSGLTMEEWLELHPENRPDHPRWNKKYGK